jgi:hypothetical protein
MSDKVGRIVEDTVFVSSKDTNQRICQKGAVQNYKISHAEDPASRPRNESRTS